MNQFRPISNISNRECHRIIDKANLEDHDESDDERIALKTEPIPTWLDAADSGAHAF